MDGLNLIYVVFEQRDFWMNFFLMGLLYCIVFNFGVIIFNFLYKEYCLIVVFVCDLRYDLCI